MRVVIVSRIYAPEVSAASALLQSWAVEFRDRGHDVIVITTKPPPRHTPDDPPGIAVKRAPVLRDKQQYVRGYASYLSFDLPLFWRLMRTPRADLYVVEPPPTTVAVVRAVAGLKGTPYVVDAADLWSDAAAMATRSRFVLRALSLLERWGLRGARHLFAAHQPLIDRFREVGIRTPSTPIGFGADTTTFAYSEPVSTSPHFVYAGTHSEWHGAAIFVEAFAEIASRHPQARLTFIGNGQERDKLIAIARAHNLSERVEFRAPIPPAELAPALADATASLASLRPGHGYDYAFTTKIYSSLAVGCPVVFAGVGPTSRFIREAENSDIGTALPYDASAVAQALERMLDEPLPADRRRALSAWTHEHYSLNAIAVTVVDTSLGLVVDR